MDFSNIWATFKGQLVDALDSISNTLKQTPTEPDEGQLGRVYLTDSLAQLQGVESGVAVTPMAVLSLFKTGVYEGNSISVVDSSWQIINIGFTPSAVIICSEEGFYYDGKRETTALVLRKDNPLKDVAEIVNNGFKVSKRLNFQYQYVYIAFR